MKAVNQKAKELADMIRDGGKRLRENLDHHLDMDHHQLEMGKVDKESEKEMTMEMSDSKRTADTVDKESEKEMTMEMSDSKRTADTVDTEKDILKESENEIIGDTDVDDELSQITGNIRRKIKTSAKKRSREFTQSEKDLFGETSTTDEDLPKLKEFKTKQPKRKFGGGWKLKLKMAKTKTKKDTDPDFEFNEEESGESSVEERREISEDHQEVKKPVKSRNVKQKRNKIDSDSEGDGEIEDVKEVKREVKNPGMYKRRKIECPKCSKVLAKSSEVLRKHYAAYHKMVHMDDRDEQIALACKPLRPRKKDGTRTCDINAKPDRRNRRKICLYCGDDQSVSNLRASHLNPKSRLRCKKIPSDKLKNLDTIKKMKKWTSLALKKCDLSLAAAPKKEKVIYAGKEYFTTDQLLEECYMKMRSYQGHLYVPLEIKDKISRNETLTPEERKINYRPMAVRHQQKRILDHIFGEKQFKLTQIDEVSQWMATDEAEREFLNSRLVAFSKETKMENVKLSHSTIASLARSMLRLLKYIQSTYRDMDVKESAARAIEAVKAVERTASNLSAAHTKRKGYLDEENYLVDIADLKKFLESEEHLEVLKKAKMVAEQETDAEKQRVAHELYSRKDIFKLQCHLAVLLTMHTGKRPGVLCGIHVEDVYGENGIKEYIATSSPNEISYQFRVVPSCEYAKFKTVSVGYVNINAAMKDLLVVLAFLRLSVDGCTTTDRLFTTVRQYPLLDLDKVMKRAWAEAELTSKFNSTMIRHTIVTKSRDPKNNLEVDELKALARGMDHTVATAEAVYYHQKEKRMIDHSKIIEKVLKLNGLKNWNRELKLGMEERIETDIMTGEIELLPPEDKEDEDEKSEEEDKAGTSAQKKPKMIGKMKVIFNEHQTDMIARMFKKYVEDRVENDDKPILNKEIRGIAFQFIYLLLYNISLLLTYSYTLITVIMRFFSTEIYNRNMSKLSADSPYAELLTFKENQIWTKVRTLITGGKRRKANAEKRENAYKQARLEKSQKGRAMKGAKKRNNDNPKL